MATPSSTHAVLEQLTALLAGGRAHVSLEDAVRDFPVELRGTVPAGLPYSGWQLLEHLRIAQRDILEFSAPPASGYQALAWPADYWPKDAEPPTTTSWDETISAIRADAQSFQQLLHQPEVDLYAPFPWGKGQNLLREALLIADHNAYHTGEMVVLRRLLRIWKS